MELLQGAYVLEIKDVDGMKIVTISVPGVPGVIVMGDHKPAVSAKSRSGKVNHW